MSDPCYLLQALWIGQCTKVYSLQIILLLCNCNQ